MHVLRSPSSDAEVRVIVVHGSGGYSGALWPLAALLAESGFDVTALDLPLYGKTISQHPERVRYEDWVSLLRDFVDSEDDGRPLILFGASMGGMLAYEVAATSQNVSAVAATCLLDSRDWRVRARITRFGTFGVLSGPLSALVVGPLARVMIPMKWVANFSKMSLNPNLSELCANDLLGGGAKVPLGFLASYLRYRHTLGSQMKIPVLLVHPDQDAWTPVSLSERVLAATASATKVTLLRGCGHFPIEEPGLSDLLIAVGELGESLLSEPDA